MRLTLAFLFSLLLSLPVAQAREEPAAPPAPATPPVATTGQQSRSVVRVNVTSQNYDFFRPWSKRAPAQRNAVGAVLPGNRVLVTGELVANATYVELERPDGSEKIPATVDLVDYESNLALIKPSDDTFLKACQPLEIVESKVGDQVAIWQLENTGSLLSTAGLLTSAEVVRYPSENAAFLIYRLTSALQPRAGSFTTPVVRGEALTGLLQRFDPRTQNADAIPAPVIRHFLKTAETRPYSGFPKVGLAFTNLRDPQLRRYAGLPNGTQGVYITEVLKGGAADAAGIQVGDVLLSVAGESVDLDGNYVDPGYGKLSMAHLATTRYFNGDKIPVRLLRGGKEITLELTLAHPDTRDAIIEPYVIDRAPRFYVLGGLVFQELSRQYLKEWGNDWPAKAPDRFVYYDRYQQTLFRDDPREKIVILSQVLPSPCTVGYESIRSVEITEINGVALRSLADVEKAVAQPVDGFHRIRLREFPGEIILDAEEAKAIEPRLQQGYGLPSLKNLE